RIAESESRKLAADYRQITDNERRETDGIQIFRRHTRDGGNGDLFDSRHEFGEVVVWQVVQRELGDGARDLFRRLEITRVALRQGGDRHRQFVPGRGRRASDCGDLADRLFD